MSSSFGANNSDQPFFQFVVSDETAISNDTQVPEMISGEEGQLAVDVIDTVRDVLVVSTMAGAIPHRVDVSIHNDLLTIRGVRSSPVRIDANSTYLVSECYWGAFSRTIVLPVHVKGDLARAEYRNGVLTIRIPKRNPNAVIPVTIVDE